MSRALAALTTSTCRPRPAAAVPTSLVVLSAATELVGLTSGGLLTEPKNEAAQFHHAVRRRDPRLTRLIGLSLRGGRALA